MGWEEGIADLLRIAGEGTEDETGPWSFTSSEERGPPADPRFQDLPSRDYPFLTSSGPRGAMPKKVKPVPEGYHTATPGLVVRNATKAIEFYTKALGAKETLRMPTPDGKGVVHAELKIGDSTFFLSDEDPTMGAKSPETVKGVTGGIHLYVEDADAIYQKAIAHGARPIMPPTDMFWGDRYGRFADPFGQEWAVATHREDVPAEEMGKRQEAFLKQNASRRGA